MKPALAFVAAAPVAAPQRAALAHPQPTWQPRADSAGFSMQPNPRRRLLAVAVVALHMLGLWGLSQVQDMRRTVARMAPVVVRLIAPVEPPRPLPRPAVAMPQVDMPAPRLIEPPLIAIAAAPAPSPLVAALPPPPPPAAVTVQAAPTAVIPVAPPATPAVRQIPASAVRYVREPRTSVPLMSRRLRESGVVHLRVVVDVRGQPREITLARSSGFARLDEQALQDMRGARFAPYLDNGQPVEWEVIAPVSYELDR